MVFFFFKNSPFCTFTKNSPFCTCTKYSSFCIIIKNFTLFHLNFTFFCFIAKLFYINIFEFFLHSYISWFISFAILSIQIIDITRVISSHFCFISAFIAVYINIHSVYLFSFICMIFLWMKNNYYLFIGYQQNTKYMNIFLNIFFKICFLFLFWYYFDINCGSLWKGIADRLNAAIKPVNMKLDNENFQVPKENGLGGGFQVRSHI